MNILGLGNSVGTNGSELTGDVIVVKTFDELKSRRNEVKGKIVVFNMESKYSKVNYLTIYEKLVEYRLYGATFAAKYGAIAAMVIHLL